MAGDSITLERLKKNELKKIVDIMIKEFSKEPYNEKWSRRFALKYIKSLLKNDPKLFFTIKHKGSIIGFISGATYWFAHGKSCYLEEFVIEEKHQGKGFGSIALKKFERILKNRGYKVLELNANKKARSFNFYKKRGFKELPWVLLRKVL